MVYLYARGLTNEKMLVIIQASTLRSTPEWALELHLVHIDNVSWSIFIE